MQGPISDAEEKSSALWRPAWPRWPTARERGERFRCRDKKKSKLTWEAQVRMVTARTNKLLGLFRRICSMLTDAKVRRSLYLAAVKSKMNYATEVCFLSHSTFQQKAERVQRRASCWILKNQARWAFLQRETDSSGSGHLYLWPRGQGFSILL